MRARPATGFASVVTSWKHYRTAGSVAEANSYSPAWRLVFASSGHTHERRGRFTRASTGVFVVAETIYPPVVALPHAFFENQLPIKEFFDHLPKRD
jgi:hypothetical protein